MMNQITICIVAILAASLTGCGNAQNQTSGTDSREAKPSVAAEADHGPNAPFEYKLVSKEEMMHTWGPQVVLRLETTNEVAKNATENDLREVWQQISPTLGDRRVFLYLSTSIPGASPWAVISRTKSDDEWKLDIRIHGYGIDAEPYHFVNEIDRSVRNQQAMIVTLPMVNRLNEQLVRRGWTVISRQVDFYSAKFKRGIQSVSVTVTPEGIDILALFAEGNRLSDTVDLVFADLEIADELKKRLFSVIGSPEYLRVAPGEPAEWTWTFGEIEVTYVRLPQVDDLSAGYAG